MQHYTTHAAAAVRLCDGAQLRAASDLGPYIARWSPLDRIARGLRENAAPQECLTAYVRSVLPTHAPAAMAALPQLQQDVRRAARALRDAGFPALLLEGAPWRVALLADRGNVEGGLPHTHGDIICLPIALYGAQKGSRDAEDDRVRTLVHERVHVYQRLRPRETAALLAARMGVRNLGPAHRLLPPALLGRARSNPDLDGCLWAHASGEAGLQVYASPRPRGLWDSTPHWVRLSPDGGGSLGGAAAYEHPFEEMAYRIAAVAVPHRQL